MLNLLVYKVTTGHLRVKHSMLWSKHDFILGVFVGQVHINKLAVQNASHEIHGRFRCALQSPESVTK